MFSIPAKSGSIGMPKSDTPDGNGIEDIPLAPLVIGKARAVSVTTCVKTSVIIAK